MPTGVYKRTKQHGEAVSKGLKAIGHKPPHLFGSKSSHWKGGRIRRGKYIYFLRREHPFSGKQGYIAEHRLVIEADIGRFLTKEEAVHHIDGNGENNALENLILCATHGEHTRLYHPEVAAASKIREKGRHRSPATEFEKGQVPWNKKQAG